MESGEEIEAEMETDYINGEKKETRSSSMIGTNVAYAEEEICAENEPLPKAKPNQEGDKNETKSVFLPPKSYEGLNESKPNGHEEEEEDENEPKQNNFAKDQFLTLLILGLSSATLLQLFDMGSDINTIWIYMLNQDYYAVGMLVSILSVYIVVSAVFGLRMLHNENKLYATLWNGHWAIRTLTVLSHCLGLGQVSLSIDLAMEKYKERFGKNMEEATKQRLVKKSKHCVSMALLQQFLGKFETISSI